MMKKGDRVLYISLVVLIASAALLSLLHYRSGVGVSDDSMTLDVSINGTVVRSVNLAEITEETLLKIPCGDGFNTISINRERVRIVSADCPNGDCLREPALTSDRGVIVCLPHKLTLKLRKTKAENTQRGETSFDAISY